MNIVSKQRTQTLTEGATPPQKPPESSNKARAFAKKQLQELSLGGQPPAASLPPRILRLDELAARQLDEFDHQKDVRNKAASLVSRLHASEQVPAGWLKEFGDLYKGCKDGALRVELVGQLVAAVGRDNRSSAALRGLTIAFLAGDPPACDAALQRHVKAFIATANSKRHQSVKERVPFQVARYLLCTDAKERAQIYGEVVQQSTKLVALDLESAADEGLTSGLSGDEKLRGDALVAYAEAKSPDNVELIAAELTGPKNMLLTPAVFAAWMRNALTWCCRTTNESLLRGILQRVQAAVEARDPQAAKTFPRLGGPDVAGLTPVVWLERYVGFLEQPAGEPPQASAVQPAESQPKPARRD